MGDGVYFDAHMMVSSPDSWVESMAASGTNIYTFHVEASEDPGTTIRKIKEAGMKAGIGVKVGPVGNTSINSLVCSFVPLFVTLFVGYFVGSLFRWWFRYFVPSFIRYSVHSFFCLYVH